MRWLDGITDLMRQGNLVCYSPWSHKESDMTERLNLLTTPPTPRESSPSLRWEGQLGPWGT